MRLLYCLAAATGALSTTTPLAHDAPLSNLRLSSPIIARASCPVGYSTCDSSFCIPQFSTCCSAGSGSSCSSGYTCTANGGCCPSSDACAVNSTPSGCADGNRVECGGRCVPSTAVCCDDDGTYCYAGQTCNGSGGCDGTAVGLGAGPSVVLNEVDSPSSTADSGAGAGSGDGEDDDGDGAAVGVRANLALVGLVGVMLMML